MNKNDLLSNTTNIVQDSTRSYQTTISSIDGNKYVYVLDYFEKEFQNRYNIKFSDVIEKILEVYPEIKI